MAMNNKPIFSSLEKQSIYQLICGVSIVDGRRDYNETNMINEIANFIGLSDSEKNASRSLNTETMMNAMRNMNYEKKMYLSSFICQVIVADGNIAPVEEAYFDHYRRILDLPMVD